MCLTFENCDSGQCSEDSRHNYEFFSVVRHAPNEYVTSFTFKHGADFEVGAANRELLQEESSNSNSK